MLAIIKTEISANLWSPKLRDEFRMLVKLWEEKNLKLVEKAEGMKLNEQNRGLVKMLEASIAEKIRDVCVARDAFAVVPGYTDMYDFVQAHIERLVDWKNRVKGIMGSGSN